MIVGGIQRNVPTGGIERVLVAAGRVLNRRDLLHRVALQSPHEHAEVRDVVPPCRPASASHIGRERTAERRSGEIRSMDPGADRQIRLLRCASARRRELRALEAAARIGGQGGKTDRRVETVTRPGEEVKELNDAYAPSRDVRRKLFEQPDRSLTASIVDGLADVDAPAARIEIGDEVGGEQVAEVVDQPIVTGLDRLVLRTIDAATIAAGPRFDGRAPSGPP
jgi:hypothetical protein